MNRYALSLVVTIALLAPALTLTDAAPGKAPVFPPGVDPYGRTYSEWAADWWEWALEQPGSTNPLLDETGALCANSQEGEVWFLAGLISSGEVTRSCTIPAGTALLIPIFNEFQCNDPGQDVGEEELRDRLRTVHRAHNLYLRIDGVAVRGLKGHYYEESEVFDITLPADNVFRIPELAGVYDPCVDAGYYVMLEPLSPGEHTIEFGAQRGDFEIAIEYQITVLAAAGAQPR